MGSESIAVATRERGDVRPYLAFAACSSIWGSTFLVIAFGNDALPPLWAATLRLVLAAPLLFALARLVGESLPRGVSLRDVALYGVFQFGLNFALLYWGEQTVPSGMTAVVYATIPLSTALFAVGFGLERLSVVKLAASFVALAGVAVLFAGQLGVGVSLLGLLAVLASATSASLSAIFLKRAHAAPFAANAIGSAIGIPVCLVGSVLLAEDRAVPMSVAALWPVLYLTAAGSLGAYVIYGWLVRRWPVTSANFITVVIPVIALLLGAIFRGESPPPVSYAGAALVLVAVALALRRTGNAR